MKKKRFTEEQIIQILQQAESGLAVTDVCRKHVLRTVVLSLEGEVWRHGGLRGQAPEGTRAGERRAQTHVG